MYHFLFFFPFILVLGILLLLFIYENSISIYIIVPFSVLNNSSKVFLNLLFEFCFFLNSAPDMQ